MLNGKTHQATSQDIHCTITLPVHTMTVTLDVSGTQDLILTLKLNSSQPKQTGAAGRTYNTYCNVTTQELTTVASNRFFWGILGYLCIKGRIY
jgi:hypothetical protein